MENKELEERVDLLLMQLSKSQKTVHGNMVRAVAREAIEEACGDLQRATVLMRDASNSTLLKKFELRREAKKAEHVKKPRAKKK